MIWKQFTIAKCHAKENALRPAYVPEVQCNIDKYTVFRKRDENNERYCKSHNNFYHTAACLNEKTNTYQTDFRFSRSYGGGIILF